MVMLTAPFRGLNGPKMIIADVTTDNRYSLCAVEITLK